jgi:hypothetical protein
MTYAEGVTNAVVEAYYPRAVAIADAARDRAQSAYALASAVAAGIVAAGVLGNFGSRPLLVQITGIAAVIVWIGAAYWYLQAIAAPVPLPPARSLTQTLWVNQVLQDAFNERRIIDQRQKVANIVAVVAVGVTLAALMLALFSDSGSRESRALVSLTPAGASVTHDLCGVPASTVEGLVVRDTVGKEFTTVRGVNVGTCAGKELRLSKAAVSAVLIEN